MTKLRSPEGEQDATDLNKHASSSPITTPQKSFGDYQTATSTAPHSRNKPCHYRRSVYCVQFACLGVVGLRVISGPIINFVYGEQASLAHRLNLFRIKRYGVERKFANFADRGVAALFLRDIIRGRIIQARDSHISGPDRCYQRQSGGHRPPPTRATTSSSSPNHSQSELIELS
ncbi:hypothetical protein GWI33_011381 [Rhynchophorus ferrugineus]|uniref:Uncharacterized protein n=1 Tax=Rhynchophorus ferrugineus TaxID=354439 RepID=A0A834MJ85_RHYFE|nr:hypothetical protein GWI33_011381 [Rhynchophorus ferrugineus]